MESEDVQIVRRILRNIASGLWKGHDIKRLNSYGPELMPIFERIVESESPGAGQIELAKNQRSVLFYIRELIEKDGISPNLSVEGINNYVNWLEQRILK